MWLAKDIENWSSAYPAKLFFKNDSEGYPLNLDRRDFYIEKYVDLWMSKNNAKRFVNLQLRIIYSDSDNILGIVENAKLYSNCILSIKDTKKEEDLEKEWLFRRYLNRNMPDKEYTIPLSKNEQLEYEKLLALFNYYMNLKDSRQSVLPWK